jgi:hypothetical protein
MRRVMLSLLLLLVTSSPALAVFCARDVVPAATLLVPYVVVQMQGDVPNRTGTTTMLHVTNTGSQAMLVQLVVWNALGEPAVTITAALSGYDMWTVDFADLLEGRWSRFETSRAATAPPNVNELYRVPFEWGPDGRSAELLQGAVRAPYMSPWPRGLATPGKTSELPGGACGMPYGDAAGQAVSAVLLDKLQEPLLAREHRGCGEMAVVRHSNDWLSGLTANPLFFYASVHAVQSCSTLTPADAAFPAQVADDRNVLLGEVEYLSPGAGTLELTPAVHLESANSPAEVATVGPFEARFGVEDRREPLPTGFAFQYNNSWYGGASSALMLWKPFGELAADGRVADCGTYMYYAWDEDEHVITRGCSDCMGPSDIDPNIFPFTTQLVPLTNANFDLPAEAGWVLLLLPPSYAGFTQDPTPGDPGREARYQGAAAVRTSVVLSGRNVPAWTEAAVTGNGQCPAGGGR